MKISLSFKQVIAIALILTVGGIASFSFISASFAAHKQKNDKSPTCLDDYENWNYSTTYNANADWDLTFLPAESSGVADTLGRREHFFDLNGDGMVDYLYAKSYVSQDKRRNESCVYLNNGQGWDPVHRCVSVVYIPNNTSVSTEEYWGDCAL